MPNDLEGNLVKGGLAPAAAKLISAAIANLATGRLSLGKPLEDATPTASMRLIDSDTRRYLLTNLDYPATASPKQYAPQSKQHPYQDSQPASANPTINTPGVKAGQFVSVSTATANDVSQSEVALNIQQLGGTHARLNPATGAIEAVPISLQFEPEGILDGEVVEESGRTVIKIRVVSTALRALLKKRLGSYSSITTEFGGAGTLRVNGSAVGAGSVFFLMNE